MSTHLYLQLNPEALIASHLPPEEFGAYLATGTAKRSSGHAVFLELDMARGGEALPLKDIAERCVPHRDGTPRKSTYLSIYRALERVPMEAMGKLYLTTAAGRVLGLSAAPLKLAGDRSFHLYQEFCPVGPRVVSTLDPAAFCAMLTDPAQPVSVPKIAFAELMLGELAATPDSHETGNLPYDGIAHLRDCLKELQAKPGKPTKVVVRNVGDDVPFRTVLGGFYVGSGRELKYYPLPPLSDLETIHHEWWRSAQTS